MMCETCKENRTILYEWMGYKNCRSCCKDYWKDNDMGEEESFKDFLDRMTKIQR